MFACHGKEFADRPQWRDAFGAGIASGDHRRATSSAIAVPVLARQKHHLVQTPLDVFPASDHSLPG